MRQQRDLGVDAEAAHQGRHQPRHLGDVLGARVGADIGVGEEIEAAVENGDVDGGDLQRPRRQGCLVERLDIVAVARIVVRVDDLEVLAAAPERRP
jgi:hypothetical protein